MRSRLIVTLVVAGAVALGGCGNRTAFPLGVVVWSDSDPGPTEGGLLVQVSASTGTTTPTYDWTGDRARELAVVRVPDGFPMWRIEATGGDGFAAPVQHGVTPAGARQTAASTILSPGVEYSVRVVTVGGTRASTRYTP